MLKVKAVMSVRVGDCRNSSWSWGLSIRRTGVVNVRFGRSEGVWRVGVSTGGLEGFAFAFVPVRGLPSEGSLWERSGGLEGI